MRTTYKKLIILPLSLVIALCSNGEGAPSNSGITIDPVKDFLSEYELVSNNNGQATIERGIAYDLNTALFSDYSVKTRSIYIPEDAGAATYDDNDVFEFPVGTIITKSFAMDSDYTDSETDLRLIETRILLRTEEQWESLPYIWNEEGTDAELKKGGGTTVVSTIDPEGEALEFTYLVPSANQCIQCHHLKTGPGGDQEFTPIGPKARHLNRDNSYAGDTKNQLQHMVDEGYLSGLPALSEVDQSAPIEDTSFSLDERARDYLDINCAHCHNPLGTAGITSQLFLNHDSTDEFRLGKCKNPGSAGAGNFGMDFDILPGNADESILYLRTETTQSGAMMPQIGRAVEHKAGAELIRQWIDAMTADDCSG